MPMILAPDTDNLAALDGQIIVIATPRTVPHFPNAPRREPQQFTARAQPNGTLDLQPLPRTLWIDNPIEVCVGHNRFG